MIWRFFEYMFLLKECILSTVTKKIENISIGIFQLKIKYILEYCNIDYELNIRELKIKKCNNIFITIYKSRNESEILKKLIVKSNSIVNGKINNVELDKILLEYSRNIEFGSVFNYKKIIMALLNETVESWLCCCEN